MPRESLLLGLAEVSVALTGFAGIVVFLGRRASGNWTEADRARFSSMISNGLSALLFSLLPFLFWEGPTFLTNLAIRLLGGTNLLDHSCDSSFISMLRCKIDFGRSVRPRPL